MRLFLDTFVLHPEIVLAQSYIGVFVLAAPGFGQRSLRFVDPGIQAL
jgi:hypothetical protein